MQVRVEHPTDRPNFYIVHLDDGEESVSVAFSYQTPIGFNRWNGQGWQVRENAWGPTTGKHLTFLDDGDKKSRIPGPTFDVAYAGLTLLGGSVEREERLRGEAPKKVLRSPEAATRALLRTVSKNA